MRSELERRGRRSLESAFQLPSMQDTVAAARRNRLPTVPCTLLHQILHQKPLMMFCRTTPTPSAHTYPALAPGRPARWRRPCSSQLLKHQPSPGNFISAARVVLPVCHMGCGCWSCAAYCYMLLMWRGKERE